VNGDRRFLIRPVAAVADDHTRQEQLQLQGIPAVQRQLADPLFVDNRTQAAADRLHLHRRRRHRQHIGELPDSHHDVDLSDIVGVESHIGGDELPKAVQGRLNLIMVLS
jgi:hypothetical protein